jgi:predicted NBD/HSP70 family sugar kinase
MNPTYLGVNIGGTNCSVSLCSADWTILRREAFPTGGVRETLALEALPQSLAVCEIARSVAGEDIGDLAALAVARYHAEADPLAALLRRFPELAGCGADTPTLLPSPP